MEVKDLNPTATAAFRVKAHDGSEQAISFTVRMLGLHEVPDFIPSPEPGVKFKESRFITEALCDVVEGWDITLKGEPIPCTQENKKKYFPALLGLRVILEDEKPNARLSLRNVLGRKLVEFASEEENFIKN